MPTPTYLYSDLQTAVAEILHGKNTNLINEMALYNRGVRELIAIIDLKSQQRMAQISPGIYTKEYDYMAPADIKDDEVCDIVRQIRRHEEFSLVTAEEFDRRKTQDTGLIAFKNHDFVKILRLATEIQTLELILNDFESLTANGTFVASGDATNMSIDTSNFLNGAASLQFDTNSGATTAVITNSTQTAIDLTKFKGQSLFLYVYIPAVTNLTSFTLKYGSDASNYWSKTVTSTNEGLSFLPGWNLLRFDWPATSTGTPVITSTTYFQVTINKSAGMAAATGWHLDFLVARVGDIHSIVYYSKFGWLDATTQAYKENATASTDYLVADTTEFGLIAQYCAKIGSQGARLNAQERKEIVTEFEKTFASYQQHNPSERKLLVQNYYRLASLDGDYDVTNTPWASTDWNN